MNGEPETTSYDKVFQSLVTNLPCIKVVDTLHFASEAFTLHDTEETSPFRHKEDLLMVFNLKGHLTSYFGGIDQPFRYSPGSWSFVYAPEDNRHPAPAGQWLETLVLGIDKKLLIDLANTAPDPWLEEVLNRIERGAAFCMVPEQARISEKVNHSLNQFRSSSLPGSLNPLYQQSRVYEILSEQFARIRSMDESGGSKKLSANDLKKIHDLKHYLETHFLDHFTLDGLARRSELNTFKLKVGFQELFSVSVFELIRNLRMRFAEEQLKNSGMTVSEVADLLGYEHVQHFSAAFKKHHGYSPKNAMPGR